MRRVCQTRVSKDRCAAYSVRSPRMSVYRLFSIFMLSSLLALSAACGNSAMRSDPRTAPSASGFQLRSDAFKEGETIPAQFTCEGADISPPLEWANVPNGTRSFALIMEDPDAPAGVWTHWVVFNLPAGMKLMDANLPKRPNLPGGGLQGTNSFGRTGYGGPCPPPGNAHRYYIHLYALDSTLNLQPGAQKEEVLAAMKGHILGEAQLMGRFKR
jgi:Raf kinase inhibitor-like YbhB/YbcL family protein